MKRIGYGRQSVEADDISSVAESLNNEFLTTGPLVDEFEASLSEYIKTPTIVVNSGTAALHCAYKAVGIKPGDEVITPPNTFIATQATAVLLGAKIVFADIDLDSGLVNTSSIEANITERTKAVVLVDYAGQPCDIDRIKNLINQRGIFVIEDAAHSLGSQYKGRPVGSLADVTTFSFFATKNITTGEGGAVSAPDSKVLQKAKEFGRQGIVRDTERLKYPNEGPWHQEVHEFSLNYRLTDFQCALGISQLKKIDYFKEKKKQVYDYYVNELSDLPEVGFITPNDDVDVNWHLFPIFVNPGIRRELFEFLARNMIDARVNYLPAYWHPVFDNSGYKKGLCPNSELFYNTEISLPLHPRLSDGDLEYICSVIKKFFRSQLVKSKI